MTEEISPEARRAIAEILGADDYGLNRMQRAAKRQAAGEEVCRQVAMRHALRFDVVLTAPKLFRNRPHVVMARSHAAATLKDMGFSFRQIGTVLCTSNAVARVMVQRWADHKAGRLEAVSEDQAHAVDDLVQAGMTLVEACEQVGVGVTRYQSRKVMMRNGHGEDR